MRHKILLPILLTFYFAGCNDTTVSPDDPMGDLVSPGQGDEGLVACFTIDPAGGTVAQGGAVVLDAGCSERASSQAAYQWDLGDGRTRTGSRVEVSYDEPGDYTIRLVVEDGEARSTLEKELHVTEAAGGTGEPAADVRACFTWQQLPVTPELGACSVSFDASCSEGSVAEYRWFFSGGPPVEGRLPDVERTTTAPRTEYSWGADTECMYFRPFERLVRLTVVGTNGETATFEQSISFTHALSDPS